VSNNQKTPKVGALKIPSETRTPSLAEKGAKAVEIRKSAAAARQGKPLTFPSQLRRGV